MSRMLHCFEAFGFTAALLAAAGGRADGGAPAPRHVASGTVEAGAGYAALTGAQPNWLDQYVRGSVQVTSSGRVTAEVSHQDHFGSRGTFLGAGYVQGFGPTWIGALSAGSSAGGVFLPRFRVDGSLSRKWLERQRLVTTLGFGYYRSKERYFDLGLLASATYYFEAPWIVEIGVRLNLSNPGEVASARAFGSLTFGRTRRHFVTLRIDAGREGYQVLSEKDVLNRFSSAEQSLIGRQWITDALGAILRATHYENPSYARWGVEIGGFIDF